MKCKNTDCQNETINGNVYCSLKCRNIYVNKHIRDYSKNGSGLKKAAENIKKSKEKEYLKGDKPSCKECNQFLPYEKRKNKFCNKKCSIKYINRNKKGATYNVSEVGLSNIIKSNKKRFQHLKNDYNKNPSYCKRCNKKLEYKNRNRSFCSNKCYRPNMNKDGLGKYRVESKFRFNLSDYPNEFDFDLVKTHGWYSAANRGNNLYGVSRDHIYSVLDGYKNNIDPSIISHPANCRLMLHSKNISKYSKSDITIDDLMRRINEWNEKYGRVV